MEDYMHTDSDTHTCTDFMMTQESKFKANTVIQKGQTEERNKGWMYRHGLGFMSETSEM